MKRIVLVYTTLVQKVKKVKFQLDFTVGIFIAPLLSLRLSEHSESAMPRPEKIATPRIELWPVD